jgi:hypothetical protein
MTSFGLLVRVVERVPVPYSNRIGARDEVWPFACWSSWSRFSGSARTIQQVLFRWGRAHRGELTLV